MTRRMLIAAAAAASMATPAPAALAEDIRADMPALMALYRDLHANPELSMQEVRTPAKLAAEMRKLGFTVTEKVGQTGVVAVMKNGAGPTLMIRADMDGLPVVEQTGLPFASKVRATARSGVETGGAAYNRRYVAPSLTLEAAIPAELVTLAHDPQTSGGLLAAVPQDQVGRVETALEAAGVSAWRIGRVEPTDSPGVALT